MPRELLPALQGVHGFRREYNLDYRKYIKYHTKRQSYQIYQIFATKKPLFQKAWASDMS